ncbi:hypothetical protein BBO99_00008396 [Phytophthora kernoviae]|uniref:Cyclin-dependent kinase 2 homolog n=2 Tax=Phytophthora kernoviae TaxID=325452 RepID=A0A421FAZ4_9STRA|nr:hypothetical protein G195_009432 [Phytophthora kernoviae 00238/432]KAG2511718.1 hypothetical protein JM16_008157 [Phytophthora kernoviae]KAG2515814.1 hypothetical protein JM18_007982 [Phytophthora kernoviae]RLN36602.1 hypothetical protein BBI17_008347 [Phytophthora kernoviae]RLN75353.1 hypothetical protein BBO99_00008396 [Phytophthora kernoviae]
MGSDAPKRLGAYEKHAEIGRGTYGTVYLGYHCTSRQRVAIKKVLGRLEVGRHEASILKQCQETVECNDKLYLVMEFMDNDLETLIGATESVPILDVSQVKMYLKMLLQGVQELHTRGILHRDLKPNNLLLSKTQHCAKITDFGMATVIEVERKEEDDDTDGDKVSKKTKRSVQVVTRAYRAPELFFGEESYGFEVDVWSVGCIFAEMLLRRPLADGSSDIDQLSKIFSALGSPTENGWEDASELPFYLRFKDTNPTPLVEQFPMLSTAGIDLLSLLLALNPKKRISVKEALEHEFFRELPEPVVPSELIVPDSPDHIDPRAVDGAEVVVASDVSHTVMIKGRRLL